MGAPVHNWESTEGLLATLPAHTPCAGGAEGKVELGEAQQGGWEPFMGAFYACSASSVQDSKGTT